MTSPAAMPMTITPAKTSAEQQSTEQPSETFRARRGDKLVQPTLISFTPHADALDIIEAAVTASGRELGAARRPLDPDTAPDPRVEEWFNGSMTKTVRLVTKDVLDRMLDDVTNHVSFGSARNGVATAGTLPVTTYAGMPRYARVARVEFDGPNPADCLGMSIGVARDARHEILLIGDAGMSVGKLAAQGAHAACKLVDREGGNACTVLDNTSISMVTSEQAQQAIDAARAEDQPVVVITDNGLTEVEAGTLTAVVIPANIQL